jgi:hypothetical protein
MGLQMCLFLVRLVVRTVVRTVLAAVVVFAASSVLLPEPRYGLRIEVGVADHGLASLGRDGLPHLGDEPVEAQLR